MKTTKFNNKTTIFLIGALFLVLSGCKTEKKNQEESTSNESEVMNAEAPFFQLSLAQWSMNRMIREDGVDPYTFAEKAKAWGFEGLEYVSGLYYPELEKDNFSEQAMKAFIDKSNAEAEKHGLVNLLIMVDGQGNLAAINEEERDAAVENHYKWVDAAKALGCHSIRVNLNGSMEKEPWTNASIDGLTKLSTYAAEKNINIIVENHGGPSSNGAWLANVMAQVNMNNCGTLPDFGNFCIKREAGDYYESKCIEEYDRYAGVKELMPFAKAVSAKSHDFDESGDERHTDYAKMLQIVKDAGYKGYIGVEYEGRELGEEAGIIATRDLLIRLGDAI